MKIAFLLVTILAPALAHANPFDAFVGEYSLAAKPAIEKSGNVRECIRFGIDYMTGFSVIIDTKGYRQSHLLHFNFDGTMGRGWMGHPIADYTDKDEFGFGGNYAKTSGNENLALNEYTSWDAHHRNPLFVSIERSGSQFLLNLDESYVDNAQTTSRCHYRVLLNKK